MFRTDLAAEARELWRETRGCGGLPDGAEWDTKQVSGSMVERLRIFSQAGSEALGKPEGLYYTITPEALLRREEGAFDAAAALIARCLRELLPLRDSDGVLTVGLGNEAITPDALGPKASRHILATRHLVDSHPAEFGRLRRVSVLTPGVAGNTGMESAEVIRALVDALHPAAVITVDALAARRLGRVCRTVQLSDSGIVPGSGVGNRRAALNRETLGVPVIAVGVPTVVDAATLAADLTKMANIGEHSTEDFGAFGQQMIVTPREIDAQIAEMSRLVGYGIDLALQDGLTVEDITALIG